MLSTILYTANSLHEILCNTTEVHTFSDPAATKNRQQAILTVSQHAPQHLRVAAPVVVTTTTAVVSDEVLALGERLERARAVPELGAGPEHLLQCR